MLLKVKFLATRTKNILQADVATSTTSLLHGCGCCDNWCRCCLPVEFSLPELIGYGEKLRRASMERSKECESVIIVQPLQLNEGFFVVTHTASFTPRSNKVSSLSKVVISLTSF